LDRDPALVLDDVRNEKVSLGRARKTYGVVIDEKTMEVDVKKTRSLRRRAKGRSSAPRRP
jgi:N-methylhydantoinase B/oxoprolinase/acetone carboxylase alpha subunit